MRRITRCNSGWMTLVLAGCLALGAPACSDDEGGGQIGERDAGAPDAAPQPDAAAPDAGEALMANLQLIHESPDPAATVVDVYVNDQLLVDDFSYRTATPFVDVPAEVALNVDIAPGDSSGAEDSVAQLGPIELDAGTNTVGVVTGVVDTVGLPAIPGGPDTALQLELIDDARLEPSDASRDEVLVFHAGPDIPAADVVVDRETDAVEALAFREATQYLPLSAGIHTLDVFDAKNDRRLDSFQTPELSGGAVFVVVASGFLADQDRALADFRLYAYPPSGGPGIELQQAGRLQLVHNSPDTAAQTVDLYVDGALIADDLSFREATPFLTFPSEIALDLAIAPAESDSADDAVFTRSASLGAGGSFLAVASGVVDPSQFEPNPAGADISLSLPIGVTNELSENWDFAQITPFHGVTDAGPIDVVTAAAKTTLVDDLGYGEFGERFFGEPTVIQLDITTADQNQTLASLTVDLSVFEGSGLGLVASGFLTPGGADQPDAAVDTEFGILAVTPDGSVTVLKPSP